MLLLNFKYTKHTVLRNFACVALFVIASFNSAAASLAERARLTGFVGVGYAQTSSNNFLGNGEYSTEILDFGLNLNVELTNNLSFDGQVSYRRFGDFISDDRPRIDYANLRYVSNALNFGEQQISFGRVKLKQGIYNDFRDVPVSKPTILLPQGTYLDVFRNLFLSVDGLRVNTSHNWLDGQLSFEASVGKVNFDSSFNSNTFGENADGNWKENYARVFDVRYSSTRLLLGVSYSELEPSYEAAPSDVIVFNPAFPIIPLINGSLNIESLTVYAQYTLRGLELSAEYTYRDFVTDELVIIDNPTAERPMEGYYLQAKYPLSNSLFLTARWERFYRNADDKAGDLNVAVGIPEWSTDSLTRTLGVNWRISRRWSFFAEVHDIRGSAYYPPFATTSINAIENQRSTLVAAQVVYRF